jgi:hypothetical protein
MSENDNVELIYRQGYVHGAQAVLVALERGQSIANVRQWLLKNVEKWRLSKLQGESTRNWSSEITTELMPPVISK